jgi:hypothetical protein
VCACRGRALARAHAGGAVRLLASGRQVNALGLVHSGIAEFVRNKGYR